MRDESRELIKKILLVSKKIKEYYEYLCYLEKNNQKDSIEYVKRVEFIKAFKQIELAFYSSFDGDNELLTELVNLLADYQETTLADDIFLLVNGFQEKDLIKARVANKVDYVCSIYDFEDVDNPEDEEESENLDDLMDEEKEELGIDKENEDDNFRMDQIAINSYQNDVLSSILVLLNEYIENPNYSDIKNDLIDFKYLLSYVFIDVENTLVNNNFEINKEMYWAGDFARDLCEVDDNFALSVKVECAEELLNEARETLLNMATNYNDSYSEVVITEIIMRATLLFAGDGVIKPYTDLLKSDMNEMGVEDQKVLDVVNGLDSNYVIDKQKPITISLIK